MPVSPPRPKGPPLTALRAVEAAMRLGGFVAAAEELSVTPGAISQHVRTVEDWIGVPLFERRAQGVALTASGAEALPALTGGFDQMGVAMRVLAGLRPDPVLQIAALPGVAQLWLQPRLSALRAALPGTRLSVTALETAPNLMREMFDLSLFLRTPGQDGITLARDALAPVCAPDLARRIRTVDDLAQETLLHDESWAGDWARWAALAGVTLPDTTGGPRYSLYAMAVEEAKAGAGILIGHRVLLSEALDAGKLVTVCGPWCDTGEALTLDVAPGSEAAAAHLQGA